LGNEEKKLKILHLEGARASGEEKTSGNKKRTFRSAKAPIQVGIVQRFSSSIERRIKSQEKKKVEGKEI